MLLVMLELQQVKQWLAVVASAAVALIGLGLRANQHTHLCLVLLVCIQLCCVHDGIPTGLEVLFVVSASKREGNSSKSV